MIAASLFSGCGGMDFGIKAAGFQVVFCNDFDKHSCCTLVHNGFKNVVHRPVSEVSGDQIVSVSDASSDGIDLLFGGPPCQPFSKSGYWVRGDTLRLDDPRSDTLAQFFRLVEQVQPRAFLLENVHGISYSGKEEGFRFILDRIQSMNRSIGTKYDPTWSVINTADFGVPQTRVRFFMVGMRDGTRFSFPSPTHKQREDQSPTLFESDLEPHLTAWDAIGHLTPDPNENLVVGGRWAELLPSIPEGENYLWHTDRKNGEPLFGWRTRYWCFLLKLAKNRPSWTLQAQPGSAIGPFHWDNRKLSWREMAALQTFPESFCIDAPRVEIQRQIGNAVPSLIAEILARSIAVHLGYSIPTRPPLLALRRSEQIPPASKVARVPKRYSELIGVHAAHPGTGKGRSYERKAESGKGHPCG
ncbi:MAG: DNA cytosine methyltransferase [Pirellulaceae bacterium]